MRFALAVALLAVGCQTSQPSAPSHTQELQITLGGFIAGHSESEKVTAVCGITPAHEMLKCDFYNGLPELALTEITVVVVWSPYNDNDKRYFKIPVSLNPLTSEHQEIRLGLLIPQDKHWGWQIVGASGYHI
jgi:hypothetical protein